MGEPTRDDLSQLRAEIHSLRERLAELDRQVERLTEREGGGPVGAGAPVSPTPAAQSPRVTPPPLPAEALRRAAAPAAAPFSFPSPQAEPAIPAKAAAPAAAPVLPPPSSTKPPGVPLEQRLGGSWLNKIGIVVLILAAVFFFQYAAEKGWINPAIRVLIVALGGAGLLCVGEWTYRKAMRSFAAGVTGGGIALLYAAAYAASPKFYDLASTPAAFAAMCVVTAVGVALSLRSGAMATAILVQVGAYLTPLLLSTGRDEQVVLMTYLIVLAAGFLIVAAVKRWDALPLIALGATVLLFAGWFDEYYTGAAAARTAGFAWALFGMFALYCGIAAAAGRTHPFTSIGLLAAGAASIVVLNLAQCNHVSGNAILVQWLVLDAIVVGLCLWRRWNWLRLGVLGWTVLGMLLLHQVRPGTLGPWGWAVWIWVLFGLFLADILVRAWRRGRKTDESLDCLLSSIATAAMFWATYCLLREPNHAWMGLYTGLLGVGAIVLAGVLWRGPGRRLLGYACLGQGLVLLTLAMPIQFDKAFVTIAWASQATVTMLIARRLGSKLLVVKSPVVLILAVLHFALVSAPTDSRLAESMLSVGGVEIRYLLLLAAALTAAGMASAALLRTAGPIYSEKADRALACGLVWTGALVWGWATWAELPAVAATWWWAALAGTVTAAGVARKKEWLVSSGGVMLALTAVKLLAYDSLIRRLIGRADAEAIPVANWQFAAGVAVAGALLLYARALGRIREWTVDPGVAALAALLGAFLIVWVGSFEVDRYFTGPGGRGFADPGQARQMGLSVWWSVYAAGLLAAGFVFRHPAVRYMALAVFAVTIGKVFLVDMAGIEAAYRIGSFLALGALLVGASFLYQRYFRPYSAAPVAGAMEDPPASDGAVE